MSEKKYCKHCGAQIDSKCVVCPECGRQVKKIKSENSGNVVINNNVNSRYSGRGFGVSNKSKMVTLVLCIFIGYFGIHRFYAGKIGTGIIWMLTGGCFCIGWIYDIIKIATGTFTDGSGMPIRD